MPSSNTEAFDVQLGTYRIEDAKVRARSVWHVTHHQAVWLTTMLVNHDHICVVMIAG